jgi:putative alpha-1,2-mannosidase
MTVSNRSVLYRFTFPKGNSTVYSDAPTVPRLPYSPLILADLTDLSNSRQTATMAVDPHSGRLVGTGKFGPSFGIGHYDLYFCADFKGAKIRDSGVFMNNRAGSQPKKISVANDGTDDPPIPAGAWVQFDQPESDQILVRAGISFISTDKACQNAEREAGGWDFEKLRLEAERAWTEKLSVIQVDASGVNKSIQTTFWSGTYRSMISPQDYTGS